MTRRRAASSRCSSRRFASSSSRSRSRAVPARRARVIGDPGLGRQRAAPPRRRAPRRGAAAPPRARAARRDQASRLRTPCRLSTSASARESAASTSLLAQRPVGRPEHQAPRDAALSRGQGRAPVLVERPQRLEQRAGPGPERRLHVGRRQAVREHQRHVLLDRRPGRQRPDLERLARRRAQRQLEAEHPRAPGRPVGGQLPRPANLLAVRRLSQRGGRPGPRSARRDGPAPPRRRAASWRRTGPRPAASARSSAGDAGRRRRRRRRAAPPRGSAAPLLWNTCPISKRRTSRCCIRQLCSTRRTRPAGAPGRRNASSWLSGFRISTQLSSAHGPRGTVSASCSPRPVRTRRSRAASCSDGASGTLPSRCGRSSSGNRS